MGGGGGCGSGGWLPTQTGSTQASKFASHQYTKPTVCVDTAPNPQTTDKHSHTFALQVAGDSFSNVVEKLELQSALQLLIWQLIPFFGCGGWEGSGLYRRVTQQAGSKFVRSPVLEAKAPSGVSVQTVQFPSAQLVQNITHVSS